MLTIVPANEASCHDLQDVFGSRGSAAWCQCQRYRLAPGEAFSKFPVEERVARLRGQTCCGDADAAATSGLVAYLDGVPAGWCAVAPRPAHIGLVRVFRVPWEGRSEDRADESVWAVTCVLTRAGFRGRGVAHALVRGAVDHARRCGARSLEGYPLLTEPGQRIAWDEIHVGARGFFEAAGFREVSRPSKRRTVMRVDLATSEG
jgi:GNAT superfamily N-acetyltransferase